MGVFSRLNDVINANLHAALDKAEDPQKLIRLMIQEMEETLVETRTQAASLLSEKKNLSRQLTQLKEKCGTWYQKAELAVNKGAEELAKAALMEKRNLETEMEVIEQEMSRVGQLVVQVEGDCNKLQSKLTQAREKQRSLVLRVKTASCQVKARRQLDSSKLDSLMAKFEIYERKVDDIESRVEASTLGGKPDLKTQLEVLAAEEAITQELEKIKEAQHA